MPEKARVDLLHCPRARARCHRRGWWLFYLAGFEDSHGAEFLSSARKPCNFASLCSSEAE